MRDSALEDDFGSAKAVPDLIVTDAEIKALRPDGTRRLFRVSGVRGFRLDLRESGTITFVMKYRTRAGAMRTHPIGRYPELTLKAARRRAVEIRALVDLGRDPHAETMNERKAAEVERRAAALKDATTVSSLILRMLGLGAQPDVAEPLKMAQSTRDERTRLAHAEIIPAFGTRRAPEVTRAEIKAWGKRVRRRAPYVANRAFELLRRVYSWGIENEVLDATPFVRLPRPFDDERESDRVLSTEELRVVWAAQRKMRGAYPDAFRLLALTLVRETMVTEMHESELEVSTDEPRWTIPGRRTKSGRPHVVPLSPQALAIVERRRPHAVDGYLFPPNRKAKSKTMVWHSRWVDDFKGRAERIRRWLARNQNLEAMPRWTIHNLRHTAGTHLTEDLGFDEALVSLLLMHTPPGAKVSRIYNRAERLEERRRALVAWADWLDGLLPPTDRTRVRSGETG